MAKSYSKPTIAQAKKWIKDVLGDDSDLIDVERYAPDSLTFVPNENAEDLHPDEQLEIIETLFQNRSDLLTPGYDYTSSITHSHFGSSPTVHSFDIINEGPSE